jgi:SAM-dependent methyltransferase
MNDTAVANDEFTAFWNNVLAAKFERFRNILLEGLGYHSAALLRDLAVPAGSRVLDVGCGWGDTAIELARKVGPTGEVLGIDCCDAFLAKGRRDAIAAGLHNVHLVAADVQNYRFSADFDLCFSRFGMMFFSNPVYAMRNIANALKPGGRLLFVTWRALEENPWCAIPKRTVLRFLPPPGGDAQTCGPGPFSMASPDVVSAQLKAAGFVDVSFQRTDGPVMVGSNVEQAMQFQLAIGPAGEIVREGGDESARRKNEIEDALRAELARYQQANGEVMMQSGSWAISAYKPKH